MIASIGFYAFAGFSDLILIASSIFANWIIVILFRRGVLRIVVAVVFNIGLLAFFKYRWFLFGNEINQSITFISDILPLGISFYCFQILSYHVDCVRRTAPEADSARIFALFVSFFPQLIAGPIVRPNQLIPALGRIFSGHLPRLWMPTFGLSLCLVGLVKKIVFADSLAPLVDEIFFEQPANVAEAWLGAWLFTFQIYFDFSGYSDIALGSAYLLGIRLPVNFRTPYVSLSPREFWQRWHITLSNWIRDYVYLPLGGNGGGAFRQAIVLVVVMSIAGFWHGAGWNFILWGGVWGGCIAAARVGHRLFPVALPVVLSWPLFMILVVTTWVLFRAPDLKTALDYVGTMYGFGEATLTTEWSWNIWALLGCASLMILHWAEAYFLHTKRILHFARRWNSPAYWGFATGLCLWLVMIPTYGTNPFIYFRF